MQAIQFTAKSTHFCLADPSTCERTWRVLRRRWPRVLSACLMGNHLHVLVEGVDPAEESAWLLRALRRMRGWPGATVEASPAQGRVKLRRDLRYIALNPCRAGLARDPLAWLWSTHRELFGAVVEPWVDRDRILQLEGSLEAHHAYVSSDPSVDVSGTPPPRSARSTQHAVRPLGDVLLAARAATRGGDPRQRGPARDLFLALAADQGWRNPTQLAALCGISRQAVARAWRRDIDLGPGRACLGDPRLLAAVRPSAPRRILR